MIDNAKIKKIVTNLKMLTESGDLSWTVEKGIFSSNFMDDLYELCPIMLTINKSPMGIVAISEDLRDLYGYLNERIIADAVIDKLDSACDKKFLG